ncbi:filamentous hemagglutinin N-terminal domain-containing protein [Capilliphycus salinus ALCB114379]|uniref:two-partner secretion domain-containing protein n=1 Tax=Capilliphycus salinus TaxID=2768948 RepID=UPI0039A46919
MVQHPLLDLSLFTGLIVLSSIIPVLPAQAQIVPDNSLGSENSVVTPNVNIRGINSDRIDGGAVRGGNLFHSFQEFNVEVGRGAYFSNPDNIVNILTRVTGDNISQILGTLGVLGNANLFLINPNGIVFGPNARLDVGGSFFATTADGILFENGFEFAASNPAAPPLLTINMPVGLNIRENPGTIVNQAAPQLVRPDGSALRNDAGFLISQGLNVPQNQTLALVGGDVLFDNGFAISPGSRIQLGGLSEPGIIQINPDNSLSFPDNIQRGNVALTNESEINVRGNGGGDVNINARNVEISGDSVIRVGIDQGLGFLEAQAGDVNINAQENILLTGAGSSIRNAIDTNGIGQSGNINITANSLRMNNGAFINTLIFGQGNAGNINVKAASVEASGTSPNGEFRSGFFADVNDTGMGNGGNIQIETGQFRLTEGARIQIALFGQGNAGSLSILATDSVELSNSSILGEIAENAVGSGGNLEISTSSLNATNGQISLSASGNGNAGNIYLEAQNINLSNSIVFGETSGTDNIGNITIDTGTLVLRDGADIRLDVNPEATGSTGNITVNASESIEIIGVSPTGITSRIATRTLGNGSAGSVIINTPRLAVRNGGTIFASSFNTGQAGDVIINASESIEVRGGSPFQFDPESVEFGTEPSIPLEDATAIFSDISTSSDNVEGSAGSVFITTNKLTLQEGGEIGTSATGRGSSGVVQVKANEVEIAGELSINGLNSSSGLEVFTNGAGTAGTLNLETGRLTIRDGGNISVRSLNGSSAGSINIQASVVELIGEGRFPSENGETIFPSGIFVTTGTLSGGSRVGSITLEADQLRILNGAQISTFSGDVGSSGSINIRANTIEISGRGTRTVTLSTGEIGIGSQIAAQAGNGGNTGDISITTQRLIGQDGALIRTDSSGTGSSGSISIQSQEVIFDDQVNISSGTAGAGNGGNITIETEQLRVQNGSIISSGISLPIESEITTVEIPPNRRGGTVLIKASESINVEGEGTAIFTGGSEGAIGNGGNIIIETGDLTVNNRASLSTGTLGNGNAGFINIQAENIELTDRAFVNALVAETAVGNGGTITIDAEQLIVRDQSNIFVNSRGVGNPGNIDVSASQVRLEQGGLFAESVTGEGGNIAINSPDIRVRESQISAAGSQSGQTFDGNIDINSNLLVLLENSQIVTSAFDPTGGSNINIRPFESAELGLLQSQNSIINAAGEVSIDTTLNFDPPESLEVTVVDPAELIAQDPCKQRGDSQFIITGRGGIAPNPVQDSSAIPGLIELESPLIQPVTPQANTSSEPPQQQSENSDNNTVDSRTIVPARGWVRDENGNVLLVGYDPTNMGVQRQRPNPQTCQPGS